MERINEDDSRPQLKYEQFMQGEGIPIFKAASGVDDVTALPRRPWARTGGLGTFIELLSTFQSKRGMFVCEIPGGKSLEVQHHLYEQFTLILEGRGATEIWQEGRPKQVFEWGPGSLFAPPKNTFYRLYNGGRERVLFLAITTAPEVMNGLSEIESVFNCKDNFTDSYTGQDDYFTQTQNRVREGGRYGATYWYTNFISDVIRETVDDREHKVAGGQLTGYRMAGEFPRGHISEWPVGRYHKAHYHGPGAVLVGLKGKGYVNLWPKELGLHPWQDGHGDKVVQVQWGPNSIYSPPDGWFHQHMSTGKVPARHVACYGGSSPAANTRSPDSDVMVPVREGGQLINYEDEDPEVRRYFIEANAKEGVECTMPPVTYSTDPLPPEALARLGVRG